MAHIQLISLLEVKSPDNKIWKLSYAFPIIIRQLMKTEHTFSVLDRHLHLKNMQELIAACLNSNAFIFGISAYSCHYSDAKQLIRAIRDHCQNAIIIIGGLLALDN
jgi:pentose-5-phosphate-3-epimerase